MSVCPTNNLSHSGTGDNHDMFQDNISRREGVSGEKTQEIIGRYEDNVEMSWRKCVTNSF